MAYSSFILFVVARPLSAAPSCSGVRLECKETHESISLYRRISPYGGARVSLVPVRSRSKANHASGEDKASGCCATTSVILLTSPAGSFVVGVILVTGSVFFLPTGPLDFCNRYSEPFLIKLRSSRSSSNCSSARRSSSICLTASGFAMKSPSITNFSSASCGVPKPSSELSVNRSTRLSN